VTLVEKQDYSLLRSENERLLADVEKLKQRLREEISKTSAGVRLDLNLEKGRMRDELSARELKIREVETRIEVGTFSACCCVGDGSSRPRSRNFGGRWSRSSLMSFSVGSFDCLISS
jgi:hypothetical protein